MHPVLDHVTITSAQDSSTLELFDHASRSYSVRLRGCGFAGIVGVDTYDPVGRLASFFRDLATHSHGWRGEKDWGSLEGELSFVATCDATGHITLRVRLRGGPFYHWSLAGVLLLEAGQLDNIAKQVESLLAPRKA